MANKKASQAVDIKDIEDVLKALADGTRLRILGLLAAGETCVCTLQQSLKLPQSKVSRHLAYLRRAGLVETRKDRFWVHYRLARARTPVLNVLLSSVRHCIGHLGTAQEDLKRLWERSECCNLASVEEMPVASCCEGLQVTGVAERSPAAPPHRSS